MRYIRGMRSYVVAGGLMLTLAACGPKVVSKPAADADVVFYAGSEPVAVGSALAVMVTWHGWCEQPSIGVEGGGGAGAGPCEAVPHTVSFRCDDDACRWRATSATGYQVIVSRPGALRGFAIVTPTRGGGPRTYPLAPVEVVEPDAAAMSCAVMGDHLAVTIALSHGGRPVQASAPTLTVNGARCTYDAPLAAGELSAPMTSLSYTCDGTPADIKAEVMNDAYRLVTSATCAP